MMFRISACSPSLKCQWVTSVCHVSFGRSAFEAGQAATRQGTVALNIVPVEPRLHAKGPLAYGVFSTLPSELTVLGTSGSTVYTENLQTKATEAAQFCEGYAEP
jgi:hypothetical protein